MDPFDKHRADPAVLAERARHLADLALEAVDIEALTRTAYQPAVAAWDGIAAAELRAAPQPVRDRAYAVASSLTWAATATRVWAGHVRSFQAAVDVLRDERLSVPAEVERQLPAWSAWPVFDRDLVRERKREELIRDLHRRWNEAYERHIESGSREVAGLLNHGPTWQNLLLARRRGGLAASALHRFLTAAWEAAAAPEEALRLAARFHDPAHRPTAEEIAQLRELLARYAAAPAFWRRFLTGLGPDRLLVLAGRLALAPTASAKGLGGTVGSIQALLGAGLALATARELPATWLRALTRAGRRRYAVSTVRGGHPVTVQLYGYQLLGPLLRSGEYGDRFLQVVGGDLVDFERVPAGTVRWGGWLEGLGLHAGSMRLDWSGVDEAGFDPVSGLVSALERNPQGALGLLSGGERLDYLLTDREWPPVGPDLRRGHAGQGSGLAAFGRMLEQVVRLADPRAVRLVEQIVYEINVDEQAMGYANGAAPGQAWTRTVPFPEHDLVPPVLREPLAGILADYVVDVNAAVRDSGSAMPGGLGARLDPTQLVRLLADLGKSRPAYETVLAAQAAYAGTAYHFYLSGEAGLRPDSLVDRLAAAEGVARGYGTVAGALDAGAAGADWHARWQRDAAANARVATGLAAADLIVGAGADLVSARAPGLGYAAGELAGHVLGGVGDELAVDHTGLSTYRSAVRFGDGRQAAADLAEAALLRSGQLEGLAEHGLLEPDGRPRPVAEWDGRDRASWEAYKDGPGAATAAALPDRAGAAYQDGVERARLTLSGVVAN